MKIKTHQAPSLPRTHMTVDEPIDKKLLKYEPIKDCFSQASFTLLTGRMGSGKTSTTISLIKGVFKKCFHDIIIVIPAISLRSIKEEDNVFALLPDENIFHDFNEETMREIEKRVTENANDGYNTLLIVDDFGSRMKDLSSPEYKVFKRLVIKIRHLRTSMMLLCQNIFQLEKQVRELVTNVLFFDMGVSQNEKLIREFLPYNDKQCEDIMSAFTKPHDFIILNTISHRLFRNLKDELLFEKNDL